MCLQNFYRDETPLVIDYGACLRYLNANDKENLISLEQQDTPETVERSESPDQDFDYNDPGIQNRLAGYRFFACNQLKHLN